MRTEQLQSRGARGQRELQQEAEQTTKAQAAAQSAAERLDWLQEQMTAVAADKTTLLGKLESAAKAQREAQSQVGSPGRSGTAVPVCPRLGGTVQAGEWQRGRGGVLC